MYRNEIDRQVKIRQIDGINQIDSTYNTEISVDRYMDRTKRARQVEKELEISINYITVKTKKLNNNLNGKNIDGK